MYLEGCVVALMATKLLLSDGQRAVGSIFLTLVPLPRTPKRLAFVVHDDIYCDCNMFRQFLLQWMLLRLESSLQLKFGYS
jgi:hypothetical protein